MSPVIRELPTQKALMFRHSLNSFSPRNDFYYRGKVKVAGSFAQLLDRMGIEQGYNMKQYLCTIRPCAVKNSIRKSSRRRRARWIIL